MLPVQAEEEQHEHCPTCGAELRTATIRLQSLERPTQIVDRYICPNCGARYTPEDLHPGGPASQA
jgi:transposase-like protein